MPANFSREMGALPALIKLAQMNDMKTRLRCAVAFANLSYEPTVRGLMVEKNVVPVIADLSSPSPSYAPPWTAANEQNYTAEEDKDPAPKDPALRDGRRRTTPTTSPPRTKPPPRRAAPTPGERSG